MICLKCGVDLISSADNIDNNGLCSKCYFEKQIISNDEKIIISDFYSGKFDNWTIKDFRERYNK